MGEVLAPLQKKLGQLVRLSYRMGCQIRSQVTAVGGVAIPQRVIDTADPYSRSSETTGNSQSGNGKTENQGGVGQINIFHLTYWCR